MKAAQTLALDKTKQRIVVEKTEKIKRQIKCGDISIKEDRRAKKVKAEQNRGLVYVAHLPHGFYEEEMKEYFTQFGKITNVKVCRSKKNGNSKGFGYVEFAHSDVAKIAAETMNNYIMFKKRIIAQYVPYEERPKSIFHGKQSKPENFSKLRRRARNTATKNQRIDQETYLKQSSARLTRLQKRLNKIKNYGINYDIKPVDVPETLAE